MISSTMLRAERDAFAAKIPQLQAIADELEGLTVAVLRSGDAKRADAHQAALAKAQQDVKANHDVITAVEAELAEAERRERQEARQALAPEAKKLVERVEKAHSDLLAGLVVVVSAVQTLHQIEGEASTIASQGGSRHRFTVPRDHGWVAQMLTDLLRDKQPSAMVEGRQLSAIRQLAEALAGEEAV